MRWAEADFETTTDAMDCRVWAWGVCFCDDVEGWEWGTELSEFMAFCFDNPAIYHFHNLAFDGRFIVDWLFNNGYTFTTEKPRKGEFSTLVSNKGKFYQIVVNPVGKGSQVRFRDSLKLFPMGVKRVAKAFGLAEGKGEIDYSAPRPKGYRPTADEVDYLRRDVQIVAQALAYNEERGLVGMTVGANAFNDFKVRCGRRYDSWFPVMSLADDARVRAAYRGGFTYCNPKWAGVDVYGGISVDYNSMYPSMLISKDYPIGRPKEFEGRYAFDERYPLFVQELTCEFWIKPDGIPMVQLKNTALYGSHEYVRESKEPCTLTLTNVDLQLFFENYDVDVMSWGGGMKFRRAPGEVLFGDYVEFWGREKREAVIEGNPARKQIAKHMLNSLYGRFGTNPDVTPKIPSMNDGLVHWDLQPMAETRDPVYIPVACFCTAWARKTLIDAIHANQERFLYCDTDSMHLLGTGDPSGVRLHDSDFCAWKVEGTFSHARHIRAKCYIWDLNGKVGVTCAGMPDNIKAACTFDNFHIGFNNVNPITGKVCGGACCRYGTVCHGMAKLLPKQVRGGCVLVNGLYALKA